MKPYEQMWGVRYICDILESLTLHGEMTMQVKGRLPFPSFKNFSLLFKFIFLFQIQILTSVQSSTFMFNNVQQRKCIFRKKLMIHRH